MKEKKKGTGKEQEREEREYVRKTAMQIPRPMKKVWEELLWVRSRDFPAAYGADHGVTAVSLQSLEVTGGAGINLQLMEDLTPEQVDAQWRL